MNEGNVYNARLGINQPEFIPFNFVNGFMALADDHGDAFVDFKSILDIIFKEAPDEKDS